VKVLWTEQAFLRLTEIESYISLDNPAAAARHTDRLIARASVLAEQPYVGRTLPELPGSELRELVEGNYRMVYRVREKRVEVLTVFEGHRQLPSEDLPDL